MELLKYVQGLKNDKVSYLTNNATGIPSMMMVNGVENLDQASFLQGTLVFDVGKKPPQLYMFDGDVFIKM